MRTFSNLELKLLQKDIEHKALICDKIMQLVMNKVDSGGVSHITVKGSGIELSIIPYKEKPTKTYSIKADDTVVAENLPIEAVVDYIYKKYM